MEGEIRERAVKGKSVCNSVTGKDYERKECIHGGKEMVKEQYSLDIRFRDLDIE